MEKKNPVGEDFRVRSLKDGDWYWISRTVLVVHSKNLKALGLAVYNVLASFANADTQSCFPTHKTIAKLLGLSPRTIMRKIKLLEHQGLIVVRRKKNHHAYYLLDPPKVTGRTPRGDTGVTRKVTQSHPNNNKGTRIKNDNNGIGFKKSFAFNFQGFQPGSKEELLAKDLAEALSDLQNLPLYLSYCKRYSASILLKTLGEVKETPISKIKTNPAALFNFLIQKHAKQKDTGSPGDQSGRQVSGDSRSGGV